MKRNICLLLLVILVMPVMSALAEDAAQRPDVTATERGGTWVFRVPEALLASQMLQDGAPQEDAAKMVSLMGGTLTNAITARAAVPAEDDLLMSLRLIDGDTLMVMRPDKNYDKRHPFKWQVVEVTGEFFNSGAVSVTGVSEVIETVPGASKDEHEQVFSKDYGKLDIDVYHDHDISIAVLHQQGKTKKDKLTGMVSIGNLEPAIPVKGYVSGKQTIYCCVLTDAELGALVAGAKPAVNAVEVEEPTLPEITVSPTLPDLTLDFDVMGE